MTFLPQIEARNLRIPINLCRLVSDQSIPERIGINSALSLSGRTLFPPPGKSLPRPCPPRWRKKKDHTRNTATKSPTSSSSSTSQRREKTWIRARSNFLPLLPRLRHLLHSSSFLLPSPSFFPLPVPFQIASGSPLPPPRGARGGLAGYTRRGGRGPWEERMCVKLALIRFGGFPFSPVLFSAPMGAFYDSVDNPPSSVRLKSLGSVIGQMREL